MDRQQQQACTYDQLDKPFRRSKSPVVTDLLCLHCNVVGHTWLQCEALCLQCWNRHPRKRCAILSFDNYTPGAFTLLDTSGSVDTGEPGLLFKKEPLCGIGGVTNLDASLMEGVNAERQAMIAATPEPLPEPSEALSVEEAGLQRTGMNAMPLGTFKPHLTRLNLAQMHSSKNVAVGNVPAKKLLKQKLLKQKLLKQKADHSKLLKQKVDHSKLLKQKVDHSKYLKRWHGLESQLRSVVQSAENPDLATNNGRDRAAVLEAVDQALDILRPTILR
ncbi:hypothetical protein AC579_3037 [Pseudocercospora musae]|uniref:Uncharacterized protein n=1 Tax=Pseudocercospora musae TaxID=113226 RepID=A0A139I4S0_9PEZI|nr:hypothetical protein AC579_3037 [Pseudocercospora musae]